MTKKFFAALFTLVSLFYISSANAASRADAIDSSRVGLRISQASTRAAGGVPSAPACKNSNSVVVAGKCTLPDGTVEGSVTTTTAQPGVIASVSTATGTTINTQTTQSGTTTGGGCRDAYRSCMDQFCLLDDSEGARCACSDNIIQSKSRIKEISDIQSSADKLYTEGVEREKLGAKANLVFGTSDKAKAQSKVTGMSLADWVGGGSSDNGESLDSDMYIGTNLYNMAAESCKDRLTACGSDANMEELLYSREVTSDCKTFSTFLDDQKKIASDNKTAAEKAVREARLAMLDTTNKYNRGECLIAYKSCVADKGGCGANFENCLDTDLLARRGNACDNVLDQCMAVRDYVKKDWQDESKLVLENAAKFADQNRRGTCFARIQDCLENSCSTDTNSQCLDNVNIASGICPVIEECESMVPGIKNSVGDRLGFLRIQFCQNDVDKCLQDKCGVNYDKAECVGKSSKDIIAMCPQNMFPSCRGQNQFDVIVSAALLQMNYQMMVGCVNHFAEALGRVCGTDMACLPADGQIAAMKKSTDKVDWRTNADAAVDEFFVQFEKDQTVAACSDTNKPSGRNKLGVSIFNTAKTLAKFNAEKRAERAYVSRKAELAKQEDVESARAACDDLFASEKDSNKGDRGGNNPGVWVTSVSFEPSLRNCHICRVQKVCEQGGESKAASAAKMAAGGAAMGTAALPGWGSLIGGVAGAIGGLFTGGKQTFCQEIESCEDVNM